jgi:3-oxoadipate enol-lactonase
VPFAEVNGQRLLYEIEGEGEPLLLVIGLGADHLAWAEQVPSWSQHFRTIAFDNRDSGQSSPCAGAYEIADMAADALALADALELDSFHLLGLSMGGAIAQELALAAPERVRTLTLALSWGGWGEWGRVRARLMANQAHRTPREEHIEHGLVMTLSEDTLEDPEQVAYFRRLALENPNPQPPEAYARQVQALGNHDARDRLGRLDLPVHVIGAERDLTVPVWKSHELAELIPGAELTVIEGATHAVNLERAEEFNALVLDFFGRGGRAASDAPDPGAAQRASTSERTTAS